VIHKKAEKNRLISWTFTSLLLLPMYSFKLGEGFLDYTEYSISRLCSDSNDFKTAHTQEPNQEELMNQSISRELSSRMSKVTGQAYA